MLLTYFATEKGRHHGDILMSQVPQVVPLRMEEKWTSELFTPSQALLGSHLFLSSYSFSHHSRLMTIGKSWNIDWLANWELSLPAQPQPPPPATTHLHGICLSISSLFRPSLQNTTPGILRQIFSATERVIHPFPTENPALKLRGADPHPDSFTLSYKWLQGELEVSV